MHSLVIFASQSGSCFQAFIDNRSRMNCEIKLLVTDKRKAQAVKRAHIHHIPVYFIDSKNSKEDMLLSQKLKTLKPDLILLCGFLKKIGPETLAHFKGKILNIHPSLLPQYGGKGFYGLNVFKAILENKEPLTGATVHWVNENYDEGEIVDQIKLPVLPNDTPFSLHSRLAPLEHKLYLNVVKKILNSKQK